jgi:hypothetical protein
VIEKKRLQHANVQGADYAFVLQIDGVPVTAWRFDTPNRATIGAQSKAGAFAVGHWAFFHANERTEKKIRVALRNSQ